METGGTIKRVSEYGAFVDIGVGRDGLLHISEMSTSRVRKVTDVINEGDEVTVWIKEARSREEPHQLDYDPAWDQDYP